MAAQPSSADVSREIRVVFGRLQRRLREIADADDLTSPQAAALSTLRKHGPASASELADREGVRPQSIATIVAALEQRGLVRRDPDPGDGRRLIVSLTDDGQGRADGTLSARAEWLTGAVEERYDDAERRTLAEALVLLDRLSHA